MGDTQTVKRRRTPEEEQPSGLSFQDVQLLLQLWSRDQLVAALSNLGSQSQLVLDAIREVNANDPRRRKLFVRSLDFNTTSDTLRKVYEQYGEVEEAAVIMDKSQGKSKGFGFVTFVDVEAAERALAVTAKEIDGRPTYCNLAAQSDPDSAGGLAGNGGGIGVGGVTTFGQATQGPGAMFGPTIATPTAVSRAVGVDTTLTKLFVRSLNYATSSEKLREHFSQYGEIVEAIVVTNKDEGTSRGYGFVTFADQRSASRALEEPTKFIDERTVFCKLAAAPDERHQGSGHQFFQVQAQAQQQQQQQQQQFGGFPSPAAQYQAYAAYQGFLQQQWAGQQVGGYESSQQPLADPSSAVPFGQQQQQQQYGPQFPGGW